MQKLQYLLQPSMTDTYAAAPSARGAGRASNFSTSGKLTSTAGRPLSFTRAMSSPRRWSVCGPNTTSTYGARSTIAPASWEATHPPTPMITCGRCALRSRHSPRSEYTFSCAFSRTEQVFMMSTSAVPGSSVAASRPLVSSTSAIRAESYSFIWQPNVLM